MKHTPPDDWSPDRCHCKDCVAGRVRADMDAAWLRGAMAGLDIIMRMRADNGYSVKLDQDSE